jgi:hypothetical protein
MNKVSLLTGHYPLGENRESVAELFVDPHAAAHQYLSLRFPPRPFVLVNEGGRVDRLGGDRIDQELHHPVEGGLSLVI